jgi:signal transduction histidine kinase
MRPPIFRRVVPALAIGFLALAWVCPAASAQPRPPRTVLTIHWGSEDFPGTPVLDAAIRNVLLSQSDLPVNYYAEYLESETLPPETASLALRDYLREKFRGRRIDVVITNATPALQFALRYRDELFPAVPLVFNSGSLPDVLHGTPAGVTGVVNDVAWAETLELALKLHPAVRRVYVVAQAPASEWYEERIRTALHPFSQRVQLTYIREESVSRLLTTIKALPPQSLIFYTRYAPEDSSHIVYTDEIARLMAQVSPVPIYAASDVYMGTGIVGGMVRGSQATGTLVGTIARQILEGRPPQNIPVGTVPLVPTFDWRQLQRWTLDPSSLPPGSNIQFRTATVWESYGRYIVGATVLFVLQLVLILQLLAHRAKRQHAEDIVLKREATLRASYEQIRQLAGRVINAQEAARESIARDLHDDVCQQLVYVSMGIASLKSSSGDIQDALTQQAFSDLERDTHGMFDGIRRLSHELHPASLRLLGLAIALKTHCNEVAKRHDVTVSFTAEGDLRGLNPDVAVCFFRIAQEALRNGLEHGKARRFTVSLVRSGEDVELTVTDDGLGFDLETVRRNGTGLGLVSMEQRAHAVGAEVEVVTGPQQGTTIRVRGPVGAPQGVRHTDLDASGEEAPAAPTRQFT